MFLRIIVLCLALVTIFDRVPLRRLRRRLLEHAALYEQSCLFDVQQLEQDPGLPPGVRTAAQTRLRTARAYRRALEARRLVKARRIYTVLFPDRHWRED